MAEARTHARGTVEESSQDKSLTQWRGTDTDTRGLGSERQSKERERTQTHRRSSVAIGCDLLPQNIINDFNTGTYAFIIQFVVAQRQQILAVLNFIAKSYHWSCSQIHHMHKLERYECDKSQQSKENSDFYYEYV